MGQPPPVLQQDAKYNSTYSKDSTKVGEQLAQAALASEKFILTLAGIPAQ